MEEKKRGEPRPSPEQIEAWLTSLLRTGAQARNIERHAPELGKWLTWTPASAREGSLSRGEAIAAERKLREIIRERVSPFYSRRLLIMLALEPGMDGANVTRRSESAANTIEKVGYTGVSGHHYRYRRLPDEMRGLADAIYEFLEF